MFNATASWMPTGIQNLFLRYLDRKSNIQSLFEKVRSLSSAFRKLSSDEYQESVLALRATVDDRFNNRDDSNFRPSAELEGILRRLSSKAKTAIGTPRERLVGFGDDLAIASAAMALESIRRVRGIELYDTQLMGGMAMAQGRIVEMQTGEGKTLTAVVAAVQLGLLGHGTHVMTVNPYLAQRDYEQLESIYKLCGLSCGLIQSDQSKHEKRGAYLSDVTYGPGYEFGFDYLRDQLLEATRPAPALGRGFRDRQKRTIETRQDTVQRPLAFAVIDEADSVLIDEASTPLVLSFAGGGPSSNPEVYRIARDLVEAWKPAEQYRIIQSSSGHPTLELTPFGIRRMAEWDWTTINCQLERPIQEYVEQALQAKELFQRDVHYVVLDDKIQLVDQQTGRILPDRTLRGGLHQAIEAKEAVTITVENATSARITRQRCFRNYSLICGMTGTATSTDLELRNVYGLEVKIIPTHRPSRRERYPLRVFKSTETKELAIVESAKRIHALGRPILIGTASIESNVRLANLLKSSGLDIQVLDGRQDNEEAAIVSRAGEKGRLTVATNVAGRGTDIGLGEGVEALGGLHVIIAEPQASVRVDRQLAGRAARHGDPGSFQMFASAEDHLIAKYDPTLAQKIRSVAGIDGEVEETASIGEAILQLQKRNEEQRVRERLLMSKQDDWLEQLSREWN